MHAVIGSSIFRRVNSTPATMDRSHVFLLEQLHHWFEALSLIGQTPEGVCVIILLESMVNVSAVSLGTMQWLI